MTSLGIPTVSKQWVGYVKESYGKAAKEVILKYV